MELEVEKRRRNRIKFIKIINLISDIKINNPNKLKRPSPPDAAVSMKQLT